MTRARRLLGKTLVLLVIWVVVSGDMAISSLLLGLGCAVVIAWIDLRRSDPPARPFPWAPLVMYVPWLLSQIAWSGWHVTKLILNPNMPIDPTLITYEPKLHDHAGLVLLGNSITLTPGTITAEISPRMLVIHTIDNEAARGVLDGTMESRVARVFGQRVEVRS